MELDESRLDIENQYANEERFSKLSIEAKVKEELKNNPEVCTKVSQGVLLLKTWMNQDYFESKNSRLKQLSKLDLDSLVWDIFVFIGHLTKPELFTSIVGMLAGKCGFDEKVDGIRTMSEIIAVLCETDAYDLNKPSKKDSFYLINRLPISKRLIDFIKNSRYLPPMIVKPLKLTHNRSSGYLTIKGDSLILGDKRNHHDGDICLDVLNTMNGVALDLDREFLKTCEENPNFELDTQEKKEDWLKFKKQSYYFYSLLSNQGGKVYFTHKVDKRGRIYAQGYNVSTQGTSFKKAMLELHHKEVVQGEL